MFGKKNVPGFVIIIIIKLNLGEHPGEIFPSSSFPKFI